MTPKKHFLFKLKLSPKFNTNMLNLVVVFNVFIVNRNEAFCAIYSKTSKLFKLAIGSYTNWKMENSVVMITFSILKWKYPFWARLFKDIKIVCFTYNSVLRLNRIWWWSALGSIDRKYSFWKNLVRKRQKNFYPSETGIFEVGIFLEG